MPGETTDGQTKSASTTAVMEDETVETPSGDTSAHGGDDDEDTQAIAAGDSDDAADTGGAHEAGEGADPDADLKQLMRANLPKLEAKAPETKADTKVEPKGGKDAPAAGTAKEGETDPAAAPTIDQRIEAITKGLGDSFDEGTVKAFAPVLDLVKEQAKRIDEQAKQIAEFQGVSQTIAQDREAAGARAFHSECDRLATEGGFEDLLGSTADGSAKNDIRAQVWADAKLAFQTAAKAGKPISEQRAVLFAVRLNAEKDKSSETTAAQKQAAKLQGRRSVAPKSGGGGAVKDPSIDANDPDAEARAAVRSTLASFGKKR